MVNIAKSAAQPGFGVLLIIKDILRTTKNTQLLANNTAKRNFQFTKVKFNFANDIKIKEGRANVPTKVFRPFASILVITSNRPAIYLKNKQIFFMYILKIIKI